MINHNVPLHPNTEDDTHCFQAALKMVLSYFDPENDISIKDLASLTAKGGDEFGTWRLAGIDWLLSQGYEVVYINPFDYERFMQEGEKYLIEAFGKDGAEWNKLNINFDNEIEQMRRFLHLTNIDRREPTLDDIKEFLRQGYILICYLNYRVLSGKEGYAGHYAVVRGFDEDNIILNDPGLPAEENQKIPYEIFKKGWHYPTSLGASMLAIRKIK